VVAGVVALALVVDVLDVDVAVVDEDDDAGDALARCPLFLPVLRALHTACSQSHIHLSHATRVSSAHDAMQRRTHRIFSSKSLNARMYLVFDSTSTICARAHTHTLITTHTHHTHHCVIPRMRTGAS
jgi:hypothetical protein